MKVIRFEEHGEAEVLQVREAEEPRAGRGEVVVRVAYAGVNFADINLRKNAVPFAVPLPQTVGLEAAGVVAAVGEDVESVRVGDRVACLALANGAYAEYVRVSAAHVFVLPATITIEAAAAIALQGITAHYLLHDFAEVRSGTSLLVHAAAGGMGILLSQWARRLGAEVIGTVSSDDKGQVARAAGATHVIRYDREDFADAALRLTGGRGVDHVIDGVGSTTFARDLDALAVGGHITFYGWASGAAAPVDPRTLLAKSATISGANLANAVRTSDDARHRAGAVFAAHAEGWLVPRIDRVFPLEEAADAHRRLESRATMGKVLLAL